MNYAPLGSIDAVSTLCLGTGAYGSQIDLDAAFRLLDDFAEAGGTFLDTAHIYGAWAPDGVNGGCGNSEVAIGRWMAARGCRGRMVVGTKGGHPDFETRASGMTREIVTRHLHESLDHLQTDVIDVYWLHRDERSIPVAEILGWLAGPVGAGTIRVLGVSNWRTDRIAEARGAAGRLSLPLIDASQIAWSLAQANGPIQDGPFGEQIAMDEATWTYHRDNHVAQVAYSSQAGGLFAKADGLDLADVDPESFAKPGLLRRYGNATTYARHRLAQQIAREKGCSANDVALAWMLSQPFPTFPIVGCRTPDQLADSLRAAEVSLSDDEVRRLHAPPEDR